MGGRRYLHIYIYIHGCGSKICNGTLANGHLDYKLRSPGGLILTHTHTSIPFNPRWLGEFQWAESICQGASRTGSPRAAEASAAQGPDLLRLEPCLLRLLLRSCDLRSPPGWLACGLGWFRVGLCSCDLRFWAARFPIPG